MIGLSAGVNVIPRNRLALVALLAPLLAALSACVSPASRAAKPDHAEPPPKAQDSVDGSYDWHGLLVAPIGSDLKEVPLQLHDVLLFRDEARAAAPSDDPECFASDAAAPHFVGRAADEYLLCFKRDRLSRIQAAVHLPAAQAPDVFAAACALWLKNAAASTPVTAEPAATAPGAAGQGSGACEGRDGDIHFAGRLTEESGQAGVLLSIILDGPADAQ